MAAVFSDDILAVILSQKGDSLHFGSLDAITLRRRPIAEVDAETHEVVSNSGPEQEFCLFDHMWKFGTSSANMHNEVAPERGPLPAAVAEERWKLLSLIEEGLTRSDAVASMLSEQRVLRPGCLFSVRTSCLHVPSYQVFRCCNGADQEFFLVDQEHCVKRPDLIACGWIAVRVLVPKGRKSD